MSPVTARNRSGSSLVITSWSVFSRKSVRYMNAGMRVANLISFSCTSFRLDLYSFSSAVSSFFSFRVSSSSFAFFLSSLTFSPLLMMVSMTLSPRERQAFDTLDRGHGLGTVEDPAQGVVVDVDQQSALPLAGQQGRRGSGHCDVEDSAGVDLRHVGAVVGEDGQERHQLFDGLLWVGFVRGEPDRRSRRAGAKPESGRSRTRSRPA